MTASTKLRRSVAVLVAGGALAVGVPAALAATGGGGNDAAATTGGSPTVEQFIQDQQGTPNRGDCPEHDGGGQGNQGSGSTAPDTSTSPAPSL